MARKRITEGDIVDRMLDEWKRGMLTFWTLGLLTLRPMYGLEIKREIEHSSQGKIQLAPGTIYQILRRLEARGLVASRWEKSPQGPPRAYYEATSPGRMIVSRFIDEVLSISSPIPTALGRLTQQLLTQSAEKDEDHE